MPRYASIDDVLASYPARFRADKAADLDDLVFMEFTGEGGRNVLLHVKQGTLTMSEGTHDAPSLHLKAEAADWLAVENGHKNPMTMLMMGKVKLKGSVPFAMKFMGLFGYGG